MRPNSYARLAGFMFLFVDAAYAAGIILTGRFQVAGNFTETAHRIAQSEWIYRAGLASNLLGALCTIFIAVGLYGLLKPVEEDLALFALIFRVAESILFAVGSWISFVGLRIYGAAAQGGNAFDANQLSALAALLRSPSVAAATGFNIAAIFFSAGSFLFFALFLRTRYLPKFLSALGLFGSALIPIVCFGSLIWPGRASLLQVGWLPIGAAEVLVGLLLLFKGVTPEPIARLDPAAGQERA